MPRDLDLVLFGATGFTGRRAARYLAEHAPATTRLGIAGRHRERLQTVRATLGRDVELLVADSHDKAALEAMCRRSRVILSTVGPYARYGDALVDACVARGTDYADINGEPLWMRRVIDRLDARAQAAGTRLVVCCGYDSVPSDLGTYALVQALRARRGCGARRVEAFHRGRGGLNGGTLATALSTMAEPERHRLAEPHLLCPPHALTDAARAFEKEVRRPFFHEGAASWVAPFVMSGINTRIVRRSAALLQGEPDGYGRDMAYQEYWRAASAAEAWSMALTLGAMDAATRWARAPLSALARAVGPRPGEGPSEAVMAAGSLRCELRVTGEDGSLMTATMSATGDPGNVNTVRFLCEAGLSLAHDPRGLRSGVLTPAVAFGGRLLERLQRQGVRFSVNEER